jgi:cytidylate kinase
MVNAVPPIIAIDGPSASGKGTIARKLALHYNFAHLDTGLLYRAVGVAVITAGKDPSDPLAAEQAALALNPAQLTDIENLRSDQASTAASKTAAIPAVRTALLKFQKDFCATPPDGKKGAVLDGRDIGTVIAPHAPVKIFVTASADARAMRRFKELQNLGLSITYDEVVADMQSRDARDSNRETAPSKPADDAVILDTTDLTAEQALAEAIRIAEMRL